MLKNDRKSAAVTDNTPAQEKNSGEEVTAQSYDEPTCVKFRENHADVWLGLPYYQSLQEETYTAGEGLS